MTMNESHARWLRLILISRNELTINWKQSTWMRSFSGAAHLQLACIHAALVNDASSDERIARSMATIHLDFTKWAHNKIENERKYLDALVIWSRAPATGVYTRRSWLMMFRATQIVPSLLLLCFVFLGFNKNQQSARHNSSTMSKLNKIKVRSEGRFFHLCAKRYLSLLKNRRQVTRHMRTGAQKSRQKFSRHM